MDISMIAILLVTAVYFFCNCGFTVYKKTAIEMKELARLKAIKEKLEKLRRGESIDDDVPRQLPEADQSVEIQGDGSTDLGYDDDNVSVDLDKEETENDRIDNQIND